MDVSSMREADDRRRQLRGGRVHPTLPRCVAHTDSPTSHRSVYLTRSFQCRHSCSSYVRVHIRYSQLYLIWPAVPHMAPLTFC